MIPAERQTRTRLMELFHEHGFHPRTHLGQNFLIDLNLVEYIVAQADLDDQDVVLEIGAGTGGMTTFLAAQAGAVISIEVDENMYRLAQHVTEPHENVTLLHCDALKNKNTFLPRVINEVEKKLGEVSGRRLKLVSNLPYSIATPVISNLVATDLPWERMVVTIQFELAQRMTAKPRQSSYGAISAWLQAQCDVELLKRLPPAVFWPRPKVNSGIVRLSPNESRKQKIVDRRFYHDFVRRLFHQRRKLLRSLLVGMYRKQLEKPEVDQILAALSIPDQSRAEELEVKQLVALSNRVHEEIQRREITQNET